MQTRKHGKRWWSATALPVKSMCDNKQNSKGSCVGEDAAQPGAKL